MLVSVLVKHFFKKKCIGVLNDSGFVFRQIARNWLPVNCPVWHKGLKVNNYVQVHLWRPYLLFWCQVHVSFDSTRWSVLSDAPARQLEIKWLADAKLRCQPIKSLAQIPFLDGCKCTCWWRVFHGAQDNLRAVTLGLVWTWAPDFECRPSSEIK